MSKDWARDIDDMHARFNVHEWVENNPELLQKFLKFRMAFLDEELNETKLAVENNDPEEIVDGLIDLCVVAIGTLNAFGVDAHKAWDEVHRANMNKQKGVKESRPNPLGLPDMIKMPDWIPPDHSDNHGIFGKMFEK
jgi:predicted HAD superfamily Cof-like phosphohydrolase